MAEGFRTIVAIGGDGTLNEVINGVIDAGKGPPKDLRIGYIGFGSSNDLLRTVGGDFGKSPLEREIGVDLCRVECRGAGEQTQTRYFLLNSSMGVVSKAVQLFNRATPVRTAARRLNADFAVLLAGLTAVAVPPRFHCTLEMEDGETIQKELSGLAVIKSPHVGGGMNYGASSRLDDGRLSIIGIDSMNAVEMLRAMPRMYDGSLVRHRKVWTRFANHIRVTAPDAPPIEADGELFGFAPATYEVIPKALTILV
jgi:diacylglycerol kinase family enzyme